MVLKCAATHTSTLYACRMVQPNKPVDPVDSTCPNRARRVTNDSEKRSHPSIQKDGSQSLPLRDKESGTPKGKQFQVPKVLNPPYNI